MLLFVSAACPTKLDSTTRRLRQMQSLHWPPPAVAAAAPPAISSSVARGGRTAGQRCCLRATRANQSTAMGSQGGEGEIKNIHNTESIKTLLKNPALHEYMLKTMVYPRENELLRELRLITEKHSKGYMSSPADEVQLLSLLLKLMGAKNTVEVGVYTGCSLLATALALPDDGKVVAIDVDGEYYDLGRPVIEKAGVAHKIDFREGDAMPILDELLADEGNKGKFDFAFVDADKWNYGNYHERLLQLVRVGGVLAYDNTLWGGSVALPDDAPLTELDREVRKAFLAFNAAIAADSRVEACQLPVADGITLCRRVA